MLDFSYRDSGVAIQWPPQGFPLPLKMSGLYYRGRHLGDCGAWPSSPLAQGGPDVLWDKGGLDAGVVQQNNWYGLFAVPADGNVECKLVSFLRVQDVAGNKISLASHFDDSKRVNYQFAENSYRGSRYVIQTGAGAGRVGTISSSQADTITTEAALPGVVRGDWLMVAPALRSEYLYLGCILRDTQSPKNFYKYGKQYFSDNNTGDVFSGPASAMAWNAVDVIERGFVPPTARIVRVWVGVQHASKTPFWLNLAADSNNHRLSWWTCPPHTTGSGITTVHGITDTVPVEASGGRFYFQTGQAAKNVQIRIAGYEE